MKKLAQKLPCAVAIGIIFVFRLVNYLGLELPVIYPDSKGYMALDGTFFAEHFVTNTGQAPLYPLLIFACKAFGKYYLDVVVGIQIVLSLTALFALFEILRMVGIGYYLRLLILVLYGSSPAICGWDGCILTESLSLSFMMWFLFFVIRYIKGGKASNAVVAAMITFFMCFLRPQFLYVFAALFVFFVLKSLFEEREEKTNRKVLALMVVQIGIILIYCSNFKTIYGIFSLSDALPRQNLKVCVDREYYKEFENTDMIEEIEQCLKNKETNWDTTTTIVEHFGNVEVDYQTKQFIHNHFNTYLRDTLNVMVGDMATPFSGYGVNEFYIKTYLSGPARKILKIQKALLEQVTVGWVLLASLLEGIAMVYVWVKERKMPWVHMALFSISMCTTYLTYFVTCAEYMRTMVSVLPLFCIIIGLFVQWICTAALPEKENMKTP